jgi:hypothetical protein
MSMTYIIIAAVLILLIMGALMAPRFARRKRSQRFEKDFGKPEYNRTVEAMGGEKQAQKELDGRRAHVAGLNIRPLSVDERTRYLAEWTAVQAKFVDEPGEATEKADKLVTQVMRVRDYPVSDFEQRAADISISYPEMVNNYRAAREIAVKNENKKADTEELRHALIYYRSLFNELLADEPVAAKAKANNPFKAAKVAADEKKLRHALEEADELEEKEDLKETEELEKAKS